MKIFLKKVALLSALFMMTALTISAQTPVAQKIVRKKLSLGDPAPALTVHSWLKGKPVTQFKKGKVYVIDFNNTSCSGCTHTITQLHQITNKFRGEVEVVSIYNHEYRRPFENHLNSVNKRIEIFGDQLNFAIAIDVPERTTEANWNGEKTTYTVVDQEGKVAYTGSSHNGQELDDILTAVLAGKRDFRAQLAAQLKLKEDRNKIQWSLVSLSQAANQTSTVWKDSSKNLLRTLDQLIAIHPTEEGLYLFKLELLRIMGNAQSLNEYLSSLIVVDRQVEYFEWHLLVEQIGHIKALSISLARQMDEEIIFNILERAIHNEHLVTSMPRYMMDKLGWHLIFGNYEEATALLKEEETKVKKDPWYFGLRDIGMHKLTTGYLVKRKQESKSKAEEWLKAELKQEGTDLIAFANSVVGVLGNNSLSMDFIDAMIAIAEDNKVRAELVAEKAGIFAGMRDFKNATEYMTRAQEISRLAGSPNATYELLKEGYKRNLQKRSEASGESL